jgi:hypothetical protein
MGVDRLKARLIDGQTEQPSTRCDGRRRSLRTHVPIRRQEETIVACLFDMAHTGHRGKSLGESLPFRLNLDTKTGTAKNLPAKLSDGSDECNAAFIEQGDAVAHALYAIKQMR